MTVRVCTSKELRVRTENYQQLEDAFCVGISTDDDSRSHSAPGDPFTKLN